MPQAYCWHIKNKTRVNSDRSCKLNITQIGTILALSIACPP